MRMNANSSSRSARVSRLTYGSLQMSLPGSQFVSGIVQESLAELSGRLSTLLADLKAVGGFQLSEVRVGVELTAEGGVNLIGNLTAGAKGAIELTFKPEVHGE